MAARRPVAILLLALALGACAGTSESAQPPMPDAPVEEPAVVDEPLPEVPLLVADWDGGASLTLPGGWTVERCEGDAPLLCVLDGDRQVGFLERGGFALPADHGGDALTYLRRQMDDYVADMRDDRANGCPDLTFEPIPAIDVTVAGHPGIRGGFRLVDDSGREVERHLQYWTVIDDQHVTVTVPAYAEDGCLERMGEFTPEDLGLVALHLDHLVADTPIPATTGS